MIFDFSYLLPSSIKLGIDGISAKHIPNPNKNPPINTIYNFYGNIKGSGPNKK